MAITLETTTALPTGKVPSGHTAPSTTITFTDAQSVQGTHEVAASGIENATASTGLTDLVSAIDTYMDGTYLPTVLGLDATDTINVICTITNVVRDAFPTNGDMFATHTDQYTVSFTVQWEVS